MKSRHCSKNHSHPISVSLEKETLDALSFAVIQKRHAQIRRLNVYTDELNLYLVTNGEEE